MACGTFLRIGERDARGRGARATSDEDIVRALVRKSPPTTRSAPRRPADRLRGLVPGAGDLVHMPGHLYLRVGRYHDAAQVNEEAARPTNPTSPSVGAQGFHSASYYPHNIYFLYTAAAFEGRSEVSIAAARKLSAAVPREMIAELPNLEEFVPMDLFALARFIRLGVGGRRRRWSSCSSVQPARVPAPEVDRAREGRPEKPPRRLQWAELLRRVVSLVALPGFVWVDSARFGRASVRRYAARLLDRRGRTFAGTGAWMHRAPSAWLEFSAGARLFFSIQSLFASVGTHTKS